MKCYVCGDEAIKRHGRSNMCEKHHRFKQMQRTAKQDKKYVPSIFELEKIVPEGMICQDCGIQMHWIDDENRASGAVLQHYRDGTIALVCMSCNTKHGIMQGDSYKQVPVGHKLCPGCKTIKPHSDFSKRRDSKKEYPLTLCKPCALEKHKEWRKKNPEKYKAINKKHNDLRKLNAEKYRGLDRKYYWQKKEKDADKSKLPQL